VSPENIELLKDAPEYSRAAGYFAGFSDQIRGSRFAIERVSESILDADTLDTEFEFPEVREFASVVQEVKLKISAAIAEALSALDGLETARQHKSEAFEVRHSEFRLKHAVAVAQQTAQRALLDENSRLTSDLNTADTALVRATAAERSSERAKREFTDAREGIARLVSSRRQILADAAEQVAAKSGQMLRARLKRDPSPAEYITGLSALFEKSYVSDPQQKCEQWVAVLLERDLDNGWAVVCDGVLHAYEAKIDAGSPKEPGNELSGQIGGMIFDGRESFTANQRLRIYNNITDSSVGAILSAVPRDYIIFKYVEDSREVAFERASPGQQASALLELLLGQSAGTLIIDQPEDDIDNRIIMKVVSLIRASKHRRQMIFATHNANIVVNGDADKVIALTSGEGEVGISGSAKTIGVSNDGAIETEEVRIDVTRIMEGGREAFSLRSRKYHFDEGTR
jgi:hypothetical protein